MPNAEQPNPSSRTLIVSPTGVGRFQCCATSALTTRGETRTFIFVG